MTESCAPASLERCREIVCGMVHDHDLNDAELSVLARPLTPEEAIGSPGRRDFPIIEGVERVVEATLMGARGQAFTDAPTEFIGQMNEILALPLTTNRERALFVATINATVRYLGLVESTVHCKDDAPEQCALEIARHLREAGSTSVGLVGLNPAIAEGLVHEFGPAAVHITDLNPKNIGSVRFGVEVWAGDASWKELIAESQTTLVTGTTLVNGTFDQLHQGALSAGKPLFLYGVTAAAACHLLDIPRLCPCAQE